MTYLLGGAAERCVSRRCRETIIARLARVGCRTVLYRDPRADPARRRCGRVYRPEVVGFEYVPRDGPVIIAGNHISFADEFFTPLAARRQVFYFAKAEYFNTPGLRGRAMAAFFQGLGQVPVERGDTRSAAASIDIGVDVLRGRAGARHLPRGHPLADGRLYKFRTGVARLALRSPARRSCRSGWSAPATSSRRAASAGTGAGGGALRRRRWTSPAEPPRSAAPGCCARSPSRSARRSGALRPGLRRRLRRQSGSA